jgi:HAD superfamily hydrolase (TIGR01549 family)
MADVHGLLRNADAVLFDFDGPICSVFSGYPAPRVAREMLEFLQAEGVSFSDVIATEDDPMEVLRWTDSFYPKLTARIEDLLCAAESLAVETAEPTPFADLAMEAASRRGQRVSIVSNNSSLAIEKYLLAHQLDSHVQSVFGRAYAQPKLMKPNPDVVMRAVGSLGVRPEAAVLVGDTVTDVEASLAVGVHSIGYAAKWQRRAELEKAGAEVVIDSMESLSAAY